MATTVSYPGVYIEELPSGVRPIVGVATSIAAFVGRARRGPVDEPVRVQSFGEYERVFGGLWADSTMSYAVQQFFTNGGGDAVIVRVHNGGAKATVTIGADDAALALEAADEGDWGRFLRVTVDHDTRDDASGSLFNLGVVEVDPADATQVVRREEFRNVSMAEGSPRDVRTVVAQQSRLVRVTAAGATRPPATSADATIADGADGADGAAVGATQFEGSEAGKTGMHALAKTDLFNLLCLPPPTRSTDHADTTWTAAAALCRRRRAVLLVDAPSAWTGVPTAEQLATVTAAVAGRMDTAALYFPRLRAPDPLAEGRLADFAPCGAVAGVIARIDAQRGVWKAPAGQEAGLAGVRGFTVALTDGENGQLNPLGVNCLRSFPVTGNVVWGARTMEGADRLASQWKYLPVRRLAYMVEETLSRSLQWVVFEPNDEPLWGQIRLNVGSFMQGLFRQGAFQGRTPREAYLVKCDRETTTQADIDAGIVNVLVGFAPLRPAEFVVVKIQQLAGQVTA